MRFFPPFNLPVPIFSLYTETVAYIDYTVYQQLMEFSQSIMELIKKRTSVRNYTRQPIEGQIKNDLLEALADAGTSPYEGKCRFEFVELKNLQSDDRKRFGTYGVIQGARYFIVSISEKTAKMREHLGFVMERVVLKALDLGLGTCWLGGTFKRSKVAEMVKLVKNERILAITPVGFGKGPHIIDRVIRLAIKPRKRKPWDEIFFEGDIGSPLDSKTAGKYQLPLEMVRLSPSAKNAQPWRVIKEINRDKYHFYIQSPFSVAKVDAGIATSHFDLAIKENKIAGNWNMIDPSLLEDSYNYIITWDGT